MISAHATNANSRIKSPLACLAVNSLKQVTQRKFSTAASQYVAHAHVQKQAAIDLIKLIKLDASTKHKHCVDLGAGPLVNTEELQGIYKQVIAMDLSLSMLKNSAVNAPRICADMDNLPFQQNSIDVVFSNFAMQWSANFEMLMYSLHSALKPGGQAYISTVVEGSLHEIKTAFATLDSHSHINNFLSRDNINQSVKRAGFIINNATEVIYTDEFTSPLKAISSIKAIGATSKNKASQRPGLLTKSALQKVCAAYPLINNQAHVSYHVVLLSLEKAKI